MNDIDTERDLRNYYRSIAPGNSVRATRVVVEALAARREGTAKRRGSVRPFAFASVVVVLTIVAVGSLGLVATHSGTAASSPSASAGRSDGWPAESPTMALWAPAPPAEVMMPGSTPPPTAAPGYTATGVMTEARAGAMTALVADGRVLVAGGTRPDGSHLASAELFDPSKGTFTPTGSMYRAFVGNGATATLLLDGRVLVSDGYDAELYDPASGTFSQTGPILKRLEWAHTATRMADGRVLFLGQSNSMITTQACDPSAEIYDPKTGKFAYAPSMPSMCAFNAVLLPDGRVFAVGSDHMSGTYFQTYDPETGNFTTRVPYPLGGLQSDLGPVLLQDGRVLLVTWNEAAIYDPATASFGAGIPMIEQPGAQAQTATLLLDGRVLVGMSSVPVDDAGTTTPVASQIYDPATNTFSRTGLMTTNPLRFTATLLKDGRVLFAGGDQDNGPTSYPPGTCELYEPKTNTFTSTSR
jgi:hypothetical protein